MKKLLTFAFIMSIALFAAFVPSNAVYADGNIVTADILNNSKDTLYYAFNDPTDIFYSSEGLYITDKGGSKVYQNKTIMPSSISADDFAYIDGLITLQSGNINYNGTVITGNYTAISSYENTLYALGDNTIDKYDYFDGVLEKDEAYFSPAPKSNEKAIDDIVATPNGCAYSITKTDGFTRTIYLDGKELDSIVDPIIDLEYNEAIYALTTSKILAYIDVYDPTEYPINNAKGFTTGDKLYVLTGINTVIGIDYYLTSSSTIIAASGETDWFYNLPLRGSTRLGKIYVADRDLDRIAVINGTQIQYLTDGLKSPVAVTADNTGKVYVAHRGNHLARFNGDKKESDITIGDENIIDLQTDFDNNIYCLTENGNVININGEVIKSNVTAFDYLSGNMYLINGYIGDNQVDATDFCTDIDGNIFAVSGNTITAIIGTQKTEYIVENAAHINAIAMSKIETALISYGDLLLFDDVNKCVLKLDGSLVGSVNVKDRYSPPELTATPNDRIESIAYQSIGETYMFTLPIEGEISFVLSSGEGVIICKDFPAPEQFVYCIADNTTTGSLKHGFVYKSSIRELPYESPKNSEAKINANNTPIYKYPTTKSPQIDTFKKSRMVTILPFAVNYHDEYYKEDGWYTDAYSNKWYRIAYGEKEGYVRVIDTNVNYFANIEMPKTNATILQDADLYRYDENTGKYVKFDAAGYIAEGTRVVIDTPFDTSREYTKVVFYRDGYGTIDVECYVRTEYIEYDGVDIIKIIAVAVIVIALIILILVIVRKRRLAKRSIRRQL